MQEVKKKDIIINQLDLIDIYRILHPRTKENIFFSSSLTTSAKIDHILGHKTHLVKLKKYIALIQSTITDQLNQK
jgi:hypothetical protein